MKLPVASDYQDAVQNPKLCFTDPELKAGTAATNQMGLPRVASGNFASVYELQNGRKRWAVRCFLRQAADQQRHYEHVSRHLKEIWLPFLVDFEYQPQGIRLAGQMYPIVKMQWVDGIALHSYVKKNLRRLNGLAKLAAQWRGLANSLYGSRLAHGDLQHGNVLVTAKGFLRLVDYDAMYVPALHGTNCAELGHANYQHPQRAATHYDHHLDNFAALVIYVSLRALAVEPALWDEFHTGENLIFSSADFKAPSKSVLLQRLTRSKEANVQFLATQLEQWCCQPMAQVGNFETLVSACRPVSVPQSVSTQTFTSPAAPPQLPSTPPNRWWMEANTAVQSPPIKPQVQPATAIARTKINPVDGAEMIWIPEGEFIMGSDNGVHGERPQHSVWLDGFWVYRYAVTVAQYQNFCAATNHNMPAKPSWDWQTKHPIVNVSWNEAQAYCHWSGTQLPTEAQWEKSARGVDGRKYPWGNDWYANKCHFSHYSKAKRTVAVDEYPNGVSPYGIFNMAGNTYEWCNDWYDPLYYMTSPTHNPRGPVSGQRQIARGNCWRSDEVENFVIYRRFGITFSHKDNIIGFRCAAL